MVTCQHLLSTVAVYLDFFSYGCRGKLSAALLPSGLSGELFTGCHGLGDAQVYVEEFESGKRYCVAVVLYTIVSVTKLEFAT